MLGFLAQDRKVTTPDSPFRGNFQWTNNLHRFDDETSNWGIPATAFPTRYRQTWQQTESVFQNEDSSDPSHCRNSWGMLGRAVPESLSRLLSSCLLCRNMYLIILNQIYHMYIYHISINYSIFYASYTIVSPSSCANRTSL